MSATDEVTDQLERAAYWHGELTAATTFRNEAIIAAHLEGASLRQIAAATGIPHMSVKRILERASRG